LGFSEKLLFKAVKSFLHLSKHNKNTEQWTDNCSRNSNSDIGKGDQ